MPLKMNPTSKIVAHLGLDPNGKVQKFFTSECAKAMYDFVPMRNGDLRDYIIEGNYIIYNQPYARYQYYGMRNDGSHVVQNYTTPGTGTYWDKKMVTSKLPDIINEIQKRFGG